MGIFKIIRPQAKNQRDLQLTLLSPKGEISVVLVTKLFPYCFIRQSDRYKIDKYAENITEMQDEDFVTLWNEKTYRLYFDTPKIVGEFRSSHNAVHEDMVLQGDIPYEIACLVSMGIDRYCVIPDDMVASGEVPKFMVTAPTRKDLQLVKFPPYKKSFVDTEWWDEDDTVDIDYFKDGKGTLVCCGVNNIVYLLTGRGSPGINTTFKHNVYGTEVEIKSFEEEDEMIIEIHSDISEGHIAIAWNAEFDEQSLKNRSRILKLGLDWNTVQWIDLQKCFIVNLEFSTSFIGLKTAFDLLYLYKRDKWKLLPKVFEGYYTRDKKTMMVNIHTDGTAYKYVKFRSTQKGGDVFPMYREKKFMELAFYNASDVLDMMALQHASGLDSFISQFDTLGLTKIDQVFIHTHKIEPTPLKLAMMNKIASPSNNKKRKKEEDLTGALVHKPKRGQILNNVLMLDFSRFYISIILALLVSPENDPGKNNKKLIKILPDGTVLDEPMYFLPALALYLIQARERAEVGYTNAGNEYEKALFDDQRFSLKRITSGLWGYISHPPGRYYAGHVPRLILGESRAKNISLKKFLNEHKILQLILEVVYGDTDSSFAEIISKIMDMLNLDFAGIENEINEFLINLCTEEGYPVPITVKIEKMYSKLNLIAKKLYYGEIVWKEGIGWLDEPDIDIKGMQTVKSNYSTFSKDFQYAVIVTHLADGLMGIRKTTVRFAKTFNSGMKKKDIPFLMSIATPVTFKKTFDQYRYKYDEETGEFELDNYGNKILKKRTAYAFYCDSAEVWNQFVGAGENFVRRGSKVYVLPIKSCNMAGLDPKRYLLFTDQSLIDWSKILVDPTRAKQNNIRDKVTNILMALNMRKRDIDSLVAGKLVQNPGTDLI